MTLVVNESANVFTPACAVALGGVEAQDAVHRCAPRSEDSDRGNGSGSEHEISGQTDVEKDVLEREVVSRVAWFAQLVDRTPSFLSNRDLLSLCGSP